MIPHPFLALDQQPCSIILILEGFICIFLVNSWGGAVTRFLGSLMISLCEKRRLRDTQILKCEDFKISKLPIFED